MPKSSSDKINVDLTIEFFCVAERELEPEQHADPAGELHGRVGVLCGVRAGGHRGDERGAQRRRSGLRGAPAVGLRHPARRATTRRPDAWGARVPPDGGVPDTGGLGPDGEALAGIRRHREQPHRLHRGAHQGRRLQGHGKQSAATVASLGRTCPVQSCACKVHHTRVICLLYLELHIITYMQLALVSTSCSAGVARFWRFLPSMGSQERTSCSACHVVRINYVSPLCKGGWFGIDFHLHRQFDASYC